MRCRVLLPTGKQALTYVKVHSSFEGGGGQKSGAERLFGAVGRRV